jgi:hypothetical protein
MNQAILISTPPATAGRHSGALTRLFHAYEWLARRELLACAVVLFLTLGIRAALLPWVPVPLPIVHDEFSYLLAADTFVSGRVANPPHPMWQHFETFHELMQPVYASKYPPLQGLVLAFGQKFFGQPWAGVFLSMGFLCAAVCWMLQGWLAPNLALLGGLLFLLRVGIFSYWMNSFWGGAVAGIGGALVLGALPRIWRRARSGHLIAFALGLAILMHSRPWEGAVLGLATLGVLVWMWRKSTPALRAGLLRSGTGPERPPIQPGSGDGPAATGSVVPLKFLRSAIPAMAILLVSFGAAAYLDYRITGNPFIMPHALYDKQYVIAGVFAFLPLLPEPVYRHAVIRDMFTGWNVSVWRIAHDNPIDGVLGKASQIYDFFFGFWPLLIPPLLWPYRLKTVEERATAFILVVFLAVAIFPLSGLEVHYAAPIAGLLYVRFLQTLSRLHGWRPAGKPLGTAVAVFFVTLLVSQFALNLSLMLRGGMAAGPFATARNAIVQELARMPGRQLVLVRYASGHNPLEEWVWNRAAIDGSQTVWARAMDGAQDADLIRYFRDRKAWLLEADKTPPQLVAYPAEP